MNVPIYDDQGKKSGSLSLDPNWLTHKQGLPMEAIQYAEALGQHLTAPFLTKRGELKSGRDAMSMTQLRNFFSEIRRIQLKGFEQNKSDFYMLKPKLAYATARGLDSSRYNRIKDFTQVLNVLIDKVNESGEKDHFINFTKFVEAVVAYHKWYGGK